MKNVEAEMGKNMKTQGVNKILVRWGKIKLANS
jgi:hypothetical protein